MNENRTHSNCFTQLALLIAGVSLAVRPALADLYTAEVAYEKGDYATAFKEFRALAELGQPLAQHDLAVMYARGEGTESSPPMAYAWAKLSAENGMEGSRNIVNQMEPRLTPNSLQFAQDIERQFNREALEKRLLPKALREQDQLDRTPCKAVKRYVPEYPDDARRNGIQGQAYVEFTVMPDGRARIPRIVYAVPSNVFDTAARSAILRTEFLPATAGGSPVSCTGTFLINFKMDYAAADYEGLDKLVKTTGAKAAAGDVNSQMIYGMMLAGLPQLNKSYSDALPWFLKAAQAGLPSAQYQIGYSLLHGRGCQCEENKALDWLRKAAEADQSDAQVTLGSYALRDAQDVSGFERAKVWLERAASHGNDYAKMYLSALLATAPPDDVRNARRSLELLGGVFKKFKDDPTTYEIRAAAQANLGNFADAVKDQTKAVAMATKYQWNPARQNERLAKFQANQPWFGNLLAF